MDFINGKFGVQEGLGFQQAIVDIFSSKKESEQIKIEDFNLYVLRCIKPRKHWFADNQGGENQSNMNAKYTNDGLTDTKWDFDQ